MLANQPRLLRCRVSMHAVSKQIVAVVTKERDRFNHDTSRQFVTCLLKKRKLRLLAPSHL